MVRQGGVVLPCPGERLPDRPPPRALSIEPELGCEPVETTADAPLVAAQLAAADQRCEAELALSGERLRVDHQPGLTLGREHVVGVQILVHEHLLALGRRQLAQGLEPGVEETPFERTPAAFPAILELLEPPRRLVGERPERRCDRTPEPRQEGDDDVEGGFRLELLQRRGGSAALEQERAPLGVVFEQSDGTRPVPEDEGVRLLLALAVGELDLQDGVARWHGEGGKGVRKGLAELQRPLLPAFLQQPRQPVEPRAPLVEAAEPVEAGVHRRER